MFSKQVLEGLIKPLMKKMLLDRETSKLPLAQQAYEALLLDKRVVELNKSIVDKERELYKLENKIRKMLNIIPTNSVNKKYNYLYEMRDDIENSLAEMILELEKLGREQSTKTEKSYTRPCPNKECRGFLNNHWKCGLCDSKVCKDCRETVGDADHKCDPNMVENVKTLDKECKACPKCKASIYKIEGCDQMFCTMCHTPFSWKTGLVVTGRIHNPHYFEMLRRTGREDELLRDAQELNCGNRQAQAYQFLLKNYKHYIFLGYIRQVLDDLEMVIVPELTRKIGLDTTSININYISGKYSTKEWSTQLYKKERARLYHQELLDINTALVNTIADLILSTDLESISSLEAQLIELFEYTNVSLREVASFFDYSIYWNWTPSFDEESKIRGYFRYDSIKF
jgi:hypothetical protein